MLTTADESYGHQLVRPAATTAHTEPGWAERCYHLLELGDGTVLHTGRAVYPHAGRRTAFAGIATRDVQHAVRVVEPFRIGDDPNLGVTGPLRIEVVDPLHEIRLVLDDPDGPLQFDLAYRARFAPVATEPNRIERDGVVVTEYMNLFQSGAYTGTIVVDGCEIAVERRAGFRDRGWGLRKHEGAPARGLVTAMFCELPESALYVILYETASGHRVFTNGWVMGADGAEDHVVGVDHDLRWDGTLLTGGTLDLQLASGTQRTVRLEVVGRLYLATAGYSRDPARAAAGRERHDLTSPDVVAALDGQNDNACRFVVDGIAGHGYVETGLGVHARYRPESQT